MILIGSEASGPLKCIVTRCINLCLDAKRGVRAWCYKMLTFCQTSWNGDLFTHTFACFHLPQERRPIIYCLCMSNHSQKNLGIHLHLEIVSKTSIYMSDIFLYHRKIQLFASRITFNFMNVEDNCRVYEGKHAFLWLPTSFGKWREGYLWPTLVQKITCRCFDWMLQSSTGQKWKGVNKHFYL